MGLILRQMIITPAVFFIIWINAVMYSILDPVYTNVVDVSMLQTVYGSNPGSTVMFFAGLASIAFILGLEVWAIGAPIARDIRQSRRPGP